MTILTRGPSHLLHLICTPELRPRFRDASVAMMKEFIFTTDIIMRNGLYSIHVDLMDGRTGKGSGVAVFRNGHIRGGDAYLFYTGTYRVTGDGAFRGEVLIEQHTPSPQANPLFGGQRDAVGIGVSGTFDGDKATMSGTALVGKESLLFRATLHWLTEAD